MNFPKDPVMLLSVINTALRDHYPDFDSLCDDTGADPAGIRAALSAIDYHYDAKRNQFI